ncbi:unnamed protein product [Urochloa humidicola]
MGHWMHILYSTHALNLGCTRNNQMEISHWLLTRMAGSQHVSSRDGQVFHGGTVQFQPKFPCLTPNEMGYSFHQGRVQWKPPWLFHRGINRTDHCLCLTTLLLERWHNNYQMDMQLDKADQVLIHQKVMEEAKDPHRRLAFVVCFFRLQAEVHKFSGGSQQQTCWLEFYLSPNDLPASIIDVQAPWDHDYFESGLGASRISSGRECHGLGRHVGLVGQDITKASVIIEKEKERKEPASKNRTQTCCSSSSSRLLCPGTF